MKCTNNDIVERLITIEAKLTKIFERLDWLDNRVAFIKQQHLQLKHEVINSGPISIDID